MTRSEDETLTVGRPPDPGRRPPRWLAVAGALGLAGAAALGTATMLRLGPATAADRGDAGATAPGPAAADEAPLPAVVGGVDYSVCGYPVEALGWDGDGDRFLWATQLPTATPDAVVTVATTVTPPESITAVAEAPAFLVLGARTFEVLGVPGPAPVPGGTGRRETAGDPAQESSLTAYDCSARDGVTRLGPGVYTLLASQQTWVMSPADPEERSTLAAGQWSFRVPGPDDGDPLGCGATLVATTQPDVGPVLAMTVQPLAGITAGGRADVVVGLLNATGERVVGRLTPGVPLLLLARDGVVVARAADAGTATRALDLAPDEWPEMVASVAATSCGAEGMPATGEPLPPGDYELWAATTLTWADGRVDPRVEGPWPVSVTP